LTSQLDILAKRNLATLANFACSNVLLGFDYDGTLAPIVSNPAHASMRAATRRLLARVAKRYPCVVISGRSRDDIARRVKGVSLWQVFGNHGFEPWESRAGALALVGEWVRQLQARLSGCDGIVVEDKKYSVTVHYRQARMKAQALGTIVKAVRNLPNVRVRSGDEAVNLTVCDGPDKGIALQRARRVLACETAIYVGDNGTDEDAFASGPQDQLLAVRVGASRSSRAGYCLKSQADIDRFLSSLLVLRSSIADRMISTASLIRRRARRATK
jgi:trehalose 6-phosphate phosphatase